MNNSLRKNIESIQGDGVGKTNTYNFNSVQVRTMPKGFKRSVTNNNAEGAKVTGFVILLVGSLFLLLILAAAYYYFIAGPDGRKVNQVAIVREPEVANNQATAVPPKKEEDISLVNEAKVTEDQDDSSLDEYKDDYPESEEKLIESDEQNIYTELEEPLESGSRIVESKLSIIIDKDEDGLSLEEEMAAGTSDDFVDTDGDGYSDLEEMLNGYNPTGDGFLLDSPYFTEFVSNVYDFSFVHPKSFKITASSSDIIIFDLGNGEFFQIFIENNDKKLNIEDWYKDQHKVSAVNESQKSQNGEWSAIRNIDSKTIFFKNDKNDYVIVFNYSSNEGIRYANMFEIIFNSFKSLN